MSTQVDIADAFRNLFVAVLDFDPGNDLLPLWEQDIADVMQELIGLLGRASADILRMSFGLDGMIFTTQEVNATLDPDQSKAGVIKRHALDALRRPRNAHILKNLLKSYLKNTQRSNKETIKKLRDELTLIEIRLKREVFLREINELVMLDMMSVSEMHRHFYRDIFNVRICDTLFSVRAKRCLKENGVLTIGDLTKKTEKELIAFPQFGQKCLWEVKSTLKDAGLVLAEG